jgi:hypothetical protein
MVTIGAGIVAGRSMVAGTIIAVAAGVGMKMRKKRKSTNTGAIIGNRTDIGTSSPTDIATRRLTDTATGSAMAMAFRGMALA